MTLDDETLMAYADGESEHPAEIEAALATRPMLAARVAEMRALRNTVSSAFAPIAVETVPRRLAALITPPRKVHVGAPGVIKSAPVYPFVALAVGAVALIACIIVTPNFMPPSRPQIVASASDGEVLVPPVIASNRTTPLSAPAASPLAPVPLIAPPPPALVFADAVWVEQPDARTIERYYPARAAAQNVSGKAVLDCLVSAEGSLDCEVGSEEPRDRGFGAAAMEVARHFLVAEKAANGMSTAYGRITVPVTFAPRNCVAAPSAIALGDATLITTPLWLKKPNAQERARLYPRRALERGKPGHANVRCLIALGGVLTKCVTTSETPAGWGFGDAAIKIAQQFQTAPQSAIGEPTLGRLIDLPITFKREL